MELPCHIRLCYLHLLFAKHPNLVKEIITTPGQCIFQLISKDWTSVFDEFFTIFQDYPNYSSNETFLQSKIIDNSLLFDVILPLITYIFADQKRLGIFIYTQHPKYKDQELICQTLPQLDLNQSDIYQNIQRYTTIEGFNEKEYDFIDDDEQMNSSDILRKFEDIKTDTIQPASQVQLYEEELDKRLDLENITRLKIWIDNIWKLHENHYIMSNKAYRSIYIIYYAVRPTALHPTLFIIYIYIYILLREYLRLLGCIAELFRQSLVQSKN